LHDGDLSTIGLQPKMCPAGIWTQGYGHAIVYKGQFLKGKQNRDLAFKLYTLKNEDEAKALLIEDLIKYENKVNREIKIKLNQNQFDALVSHTFNTGGSNTLFKLINEKADINIIKNWWTTKYISAGGKQLKGLILRRETEFNLYKK
jgi:lysozyme